jgi:hypothetical protein
VKLAFGYLGAVAFVLALSSGTFHLRSDASWTTAQVAMQPIPARGAAVIHVQVRDVSTDGRRTWVRSIDVADALSDGPAPQVFEKNPFEIATHLPLAGVRRIHVDSEIGPGETADFQVNVSGAARGHHDGYVDVVLDGASYVRTKISVDVN